MINAYTILANDITKIEASPERDAKLELLVAELQLFGSDKQIELTKKLVKDIRKGGKFNFDKLLNNIRDDLRNELELKHIDGSVTWVRYVKDEPTDGDH